MNILVIFTYGVSLQMWNNQGLMSREFALYEKVLEEDSNLNFTFLTFGNADDIKVLKSSRYKNFKVIPIYEHISYSSIKLINFIKTIRFAFKFKNYEDTSFDLIKTNQLNGSWIGILISKLIKARLIIRTGFSPYLFARYGKQSLLKIFFFKLLTKISIKHSSLFTVTSEYEKSKLVSLLNVKNSKITIRSNWIFYDEYEGLNNRLQDVVLSVGRLEDQKNYQNLVKKLSNSKIGLDIVGEGSLKKEIENLANLNNVNLNLLGSFDNNDLRSLYKKYKYYVIFSKYEGNSKSVKEALAAGCVVISNKIPSLSEIVKNEVNGVTIDIDQESLVDVINELNNNNELADKLSFNAFKSVEKFSLDNYAKNELDDYLRLKKL